MKLATSQMLVQLSDQERSEIERELGKLNLSLQHLQQQQQQIGQHIHQLNQQRDQSMKQRNSAALLQTLNASMIEQQQMLAVTAANMAELTAQKQGVLARMKAACRTQHAYESVHHKEKTRLVRQQELHSQRDLDDLIGSRNASLTSSGGR